MKNKIYPFLLGLSCIVIVALVSFKNSEKAVEKEQMTIIADGVYGPYSVVISTASKYELIKVDRSRSEAYNYTFLLAKIEEYQKEGWVVTNTNISSYLITSSHAFHLYYSLEREKQ